VVCLDVVGRVRDAQCGLRCARLVGSRWWVRWGGVCVGCCAGGGVCVVWGGGWVGGVGGCGILT